MRPKNRKSKKCIWCGKLFGLNKPWANVKDRKWCSRKCYFADRGRKEITLKRYTFICQKCKKEEKVSYKSNWIRNKHKQILCFKCSRMDKGKTNNGSFKRGEHRNPKAEFKITTGTTSIRMQIRNCFRHSQWRYDVFKRDNWTCQRCGKRGYLEAHHIKSFAFILKENEIRTLEEALNCSKLWNIKNGITLCCECHKLTDSYRSRFIK